MVDVGTALSDRDIPSSAGYVMLGECGFSFDSSSYSFSSA
jgi:hypothetical protein